MTFTACRSVVASDSLFYEWNVLTGGSTREDVSLCQVCWNHRNAPNAGLLSRLATDDLTFVLDGLNLTTATWKFRVRLRTLIICRIIRRFIVVKSVWCGSSLRRTLVYSSARQQLCFSCGLWRTLLSLCSWRSFVGTGSARRFDWLHWFPTESRSQSSGFLPPSFSSSLPPSLPLC